jgi:hypothetical protein
VIKFVNDLQQIGGFSPDTLVSSTNITEILLKVALNAIKPNQPRKHIYYKRNCGVNG